MAVIQVARARPRVVMSSSVAIQTPDNTVEIREDGSTLSWIGINPPGFGIRQPTRPYLGTWLKEILLRQTIAGLVSVVHLVSWFHATLQYETEGHHETDHTEFNGWSNAIRGGLLCYPLQLAFYLLGKETGETSQFDETFVTATRKFFISGQWNKTTRTLPLSF